MTAQDGASVHGLDLAALNDFFAQHVFDFRGRLHADLLTGGRSNITYRLTDGHQTWVLRRPPPGQHGTAAHDVFREFRVMRALADSAVPVPQTVGAGDPEVMGVPFTVMKFVAGSVIRSTDDMNRLTPEQIQACASRLTETLADLHAVDPRAVGLHDLGRPEGFLTRQLHRWGNEWLRVRTDNINDVSRLHSALVEVCPDESAAALVHGDYRIDNVIFESLDPSAIGAVVDWEMATIGDPLADLGLHLAYRDPAFAPVLGESAASTNEHLPSQAATAQYYAVLTGRDLTNIAFYLALGYFKIAIIAQGIHHRFLHGQTRGEGLERVGDAVAPLAAAGIRALQHRSVEAAP